MKIRILSDLHLEGYPYHYRAGDEEVLILAGDISSQNNHHYFIETIPKHIKILMVAGNHEFYGFDLPSVKNYLTSLEYEFDNFTFLDNDIISIDDVSFYGGTMFSDFQLYGMSEEFFAKSAARRSIADFTYIRDWNTDKHIKEHEFFCQELDFFLHVTEGRKRVVISHFMPSLKCSDPKFAESIMNPYFTSNMEHKMGWEGLWVHGHGHSSVDYMEGDTRVLCNPRGYGKENEKGFIDKLIVEI